MATQLESPRSESERVLEWRFEELIRVGFDAETALEVACARHVDLHRTLDLVARGCPTEVAARIVL